VNPGRGFFVVLEGPEGSGKSTVGAVLAERLRAAGRPPVVVREPGGTPAAEAIRAIVLGRDRHWSAEAELLLMVAARAEVVSRVIRPALAAGAIVLCDRYELSTRAYQGAGRGIPADRVEWLNGIATEGLQPDMTLIFDLAPDAGIARQVAAGKDRDRLDRESHAFHQRIADFYRTDHGPGMVHLDAGVSADQLAGAAWRIVEATLIDREGQFPAATEVT
jgi:dTMP kinase